ncbi:MAG: protein kinase [Clostridia bacterium]|nr:protein kinase [Clostridia bacterium]
MDMFEIYVGLVFDNRYRIEQVIGIGGMAVVFKATDLLMRRTVAVKILKDEIAADEQSVRRFINESKAVAMLSHQNIVNIYDVSVRDNIKYIVMEYVDGITLKSYIQHREVLNLREIISYTTQILRALDHAHKKGIVHRDIKPQNIMILKNGLIKVMDFGIAKLPNAETITMTDKAIGTVYYISPEQVKGTEIDARSDLYSVGVLMYEMSTGRLPFTAETPVSVALMQVNEEPSLPRELNSHIPLGLEQIIKRAMSKDSLDRYQSAEEMLTQLIRLRENPRIIFKDHKKTKKNQKKRVIRRPAKRSSRSMFPIIMGVTIAFMLSALIAGYYVIDNLFIKGSLNNYKSIQVENFVDLEYSPSLAEWFRVSSYYAVPTLIYEHNDDIEAGKIIRQEPAANESRKVLPGKQKCPMTLYISKGPLEYQLDDYTVCEYRLVTSELRNLGLVVKAEFVENDVYEIGYVIRTSPEPGTMVRQGDEITIYVSWGADPVKTVVPSFEGMSEAQALIEVMSRGLKIGTVTYVKSDKTPGTVVEQSIDAGLDVVIYTKIDFKISGGPSYSGDGTTIPSEDDLKPPSTETDPPEDTGDSETEPPEDTGNSETEPPEDTDTGETETDPPEIPEPDETEPDNWWEE